MMNKFDLAAEAQRDTYQMLKDQEKGQVTEWSNTSQVKRPQKSYYLGKGRGWKSSLQK